MEYLQKHIEAGLFLTLRNVAITLIIGYVLIQILIIITRWLFWKHLSKQWRMLINKTIIYSGVIIILIIILDLFHIKVTAILGAAGVLGVVVGFASQTSIGNIISGLFLVAEKPFEVGDIIKVGDKTGNIYSIDLLSIKLKTFDNLLIRIPNQTIISTEVTNITRFPIRRMDISISVGYNEDLNKVLDVLRIIAKENVEVLNEPEPFIVINEFAESGISVQYGVWFEKSNYLNARNGIMQDILSTFAREKIEIPFPHRVVIINEKEISGKI
jgi:small-conductance mechanosensitive channel